MPYATTKDNVKLYYEEAGSGTPILFSHEFAGDHRNWEPQMRFFARRHRCITYSCRGYKPSDIPADPKAYSYQHWISDAVAILDHLKIDKVHFVGLSQGGYTALMMGINHPNRLLSLTAAGVGSGSERGRLDEYRALFRKTADEFETLGSEHVVKNTYGLSAQRIAYLVKDPRGFAEFNDMFAQHDNKGAAMVMRGFQAGRPSLYEFEPQIRTITTPSLIRGRSVPGAELLFQAVDRDLRAGGAAEDRPRREPGGAGAVQRSGRRFHRPGRSRALAGAGSALDAEVDQSARALRAVSGQ
jgi:proline iminopeptidase